MIKFTVPGIPVAKFEKYIATKDGGIYSLHSNKYLKQAETKDGYLKTTLWKDGKGTTRKTHRFIAETFIENIDNKPQVNHINGDKKDNRVENLEWVTHQENMDHAVEMGLVNSEKAIEGYKYKLKKYGGEYLSEVARSNGAKGDREKANATKIKRYGKEGIKKQAKKASDAAILKSIKKTKLIDALTGKKYLFNSRKESAEFLGVDSRRISDSIAYGYLIINRYKAEAVE